MDVKDRLNGSKRDWALAAVSGLLVLGTIFLAFGMASWLFVDWGTAWSFWLTGFGFWVMSFGVFFAFMDNPYPKHRRCR